MVGNKQGSWSVTMVEKAERGGVVEDGDEHNVMTSGSAVVLGGALGGGHENA